MAEPRLLVCRALDCRIVPRALTRLAVVVLALWALLTVAAAFALPSLLLDSWLPRRTEPERAAILERLRSPDSTWTEATIPSGGGAELHLHWLHRRSSKGVAILLHGFGDDAFGTAPRANDLPEWDALVFTFRGRDEHPEVPCTLGAWERTDVVSAVRYLEAQGIPRSRIVLVASSMGAGVALLALSDLERSGTRLGGALLESPFEDLGAAARDHLRGTLGGAEWLLRPGEYLAIARAGQLARFDPSRVSPLEASGALRTPLALLAGDADAITPIEGVRKIAAHGYPLTVVRGANHLEAGARVPGGFRAWSSRWLEAWGL